MAWYGADGMLGNDLRQVQAAMQRDVSISLNIFRNVSVSNMKETSLQAKILSLS